jgi:hypothetical protein
MGETLMTDNQVILLFRSIIIQGLNDFGLTNVVVKQSNQPTQQGINTGPTVYFFKVANRRYGFLGRYSKWFDPVMQHTEIQYIESTFQVGALVLQNPKNLAIPTASDLINAVADIMQSERTCTILNDNHIGILRVTEIRNPYFVDDRDQFEAVPSFDFTLVYENGRVSVDPVITAPIVLNIHGVNN